MSIQPDSVKLEVSWTGFITGTFTTDVSLTDGPDVTGGAFGAYLYDDVTTDIHFIPLIERGRASDGGAMLAGRAEFVMKDPDGKYNPENPSSPLAAYLLPMRPVRYTETIGATEYGQFWGFIEEIIHDPDARLSTIRCVDLFERLATAKPTIGSTGATSVGYCIGAVLDARDWTDSAMRDISAEGHWISDFSADGSKASTQLITDLLAVDLGSFYILGSGVATYRDEGMRYEAQAVVATISNTLYKGVKPSVSLRGVMNKITVTRTGGTPQTASNQASIDAYDVREGSAITSPLLRDDADAETLADWLVVLGADPVPPTREVTIASRNAANLLLICSLEIGDYVTARVDEAGNTVTGWIERLRKSVDVGGAVRTAAYTIRKRTFTGFTTDVSATDGEHVTIY